MDNNSPRYYIDWWRIKKSTIYLLVGAIVMLGILLGGVWWLYQNDWVITPPDDKEAPTDAATIISFEGNVKIIRVTTRATERVTKATYVEAGDTVQTQADGRAQIRMIDGSLLSVRPNSTVVISDSSSILGGTSVRVKLDDGQIKVRTEDQLDTSNNIVEVKESESKVLGQTEASFNINPTTQSGEIRINRGGVESNIGGKKVLIKENEYLSVNDNKVTAKETLLNAPSLVEPSPSKQVFSRGNGTGIAFGWRMTEGVRGAIYDLQVAQSPFFVSGKMTVEKSSLKVASLGIQGLKSGTYFWRVRASIPSGQMSQWSDPSKFSIVKRNNSDRIEASDWEVESVGGGIFIVRGITKPGATVKILGRETFAKSDGSFRIQVSSRAPSVVVGISDEKGNRSQYTISLSSGKVLR